MKIYCEQCKKMVPIDRIVFKQDKLNKHPWTDIVCSECRFVMATLSNEVEGELKFVAKTEAFNEENGNGPIRS